MRARTHIDLFTGIGGFALAAAWDGIQTEVMCENDKRCQEFLSKTWGLPIVGDVRDFDGTKWQGRFLLTGGVPCQPASRAGKQRGTDDNRWLWPEAIRVVAEAKPRWCLFENPPGIYDVGFDGILADLESLGYEVGAIEIPACAVNSPQIRARVWIVGHSASSGIKQVTQIWSGEESNASGGAVNLAYGERSGRRPDEHRERPEGRDAYGRDYEGDLADTGSLISEQRRTIGHDETESAGTRAINQGCSSWSEYLWVPCADGKLRRAPCDSFGLVDGLHRSVLAALGNSIIPAVAAEVIRAIIEADEQYA